MKGQLRIGVLPFKKDTFSSSFLLSSRFGASFICTCSMQETYQAPCMPPVICCGFTLMPMHGLPFCATVPLHTHKQHRYGAGAAMRADNRTDKFTHNSLGLYFSLILLSRYAASSGASAYSTTISCSSGFLCFPPSCPAVFFIARFLPLAFSATLSACPPVHGKYGLKLQHRAHKRRRPLVFRPASGDTGRPRKTSGSPAYGCPPPI